MAGVSFGTTCAFAEASLFRSDVARWCSRSVFPGACAAAVAAAPWCAVEPVEEDQKGLALVGEVDSFIGCRQFNPRPVICQGNHSDLWTAAGSVLAS